MLSPTAIRLPLLFRSARGGPNPCALVVVVLGAVLGAANRSLAQERPGLLFREDWKETPAASPVTQEHVANPELLVTRHGPAEAQIKKSHHDTPADDPYYIWSEFAGGGWRERVELGMAFR